MASVDEFHKATLDLSQAIASIHDADAAKHAWRISQEIKPRMDHLRELGDALERCVPADLWPLPSYREMLFEK